jgi:hypothetical protein
LETAVPREVVRELADLVGEPTAGTPEGALDAGRATVALTIEDREQILRALEGDVTAELAELRGVLLRQHEWRRPEGL